MIEVKPTGSKRDLRRFAQFNIDLYRESPYAVPELINDEVKLFLPEKNPAFEFCEAQCFLCYKDGKVVGRVAAIINHRANETWGTKHGRFGYIDFIEDFEVARALIDAATEWVKERGMNEIEGPLGFTDFDKEGMLIHGFDQLGTCASIYNYPYYGEYMERMGFCKAADWIEHKLFVPEVMPEKIEKIAKIVEGRQPIHYVNVKNNKQLINDGWGKQIFELTNRAFAKLYGFSELSPRQQDAYIAQYLPMVRLEYLIMIADENDKLIAYGLGMPSLSRAYQKARGRMFPFGFIHLLKALKAKRFEIVDLMLVAVDPSWQGKGINALIMNKFLENVQKAGCVYAESNPELDSNTQINEQWQYFNTETHKRRRVFIKKIE